ncbi:MAG: hypothetical protein IK130_00890, partial [Oscillospiraceae bacterium]|nr:hypothetical protein [Oscillospiraceae bacterium]
MKYIRKTAAMLTALTVLLPAAVSQTAVPAVSAAAAEETAETPVTAVPDWVPKNYGDALKFRNEHGATYCADGYLLVLFTEKKTYSNEESNYVIDETSHCLERVMDKVFTPADFYPVDMELDLNVVDSQFHMAVFEAKAAGNTAVLHTDVRRDYGTDVSKSISQEEYTFTVGTDLSITETDVFGWLPDCISEITAQIEETGSPILTHDNYAAICIRTTAGTPGDWKRSFWGTNGDPKSLDDDYGNMELLGSVNCDTVSLDLIDGGMSYMVYLYQALKDGEAHLEWQYTAGEKLIDNIEFNYQIVGGAKYFLSPKDAFIQIVDADTKELVDMNTLQEDENGSKVYIELEHYVPV